MRTRRHARTPVAPGGDTWQHSTGVRLAPDTLSCRLPPALQASGVRVKVERDSRPGGKGQYRKIVLSGTPDGVQVRPTIHQLLPTHIKASPPAPRTHTLLMNIHHSENGC